MTTHPYATAPAARETSTRETAPRTLAILGGAGHVAATGFHDQLHQRLLTHRPIADDLDLPHIVHTAYGLGEPDGKFDTTHTARWLDLNTRILNVVEPDMVVAVCNTVQPSLHRHTLATQWPVMDNLTVVGDAVAHSEATRTEANHTDSDAGAWVWLASHGAYAQGLFDAPDVAVANLCEDMITAGMNNAPQLHHVDALLSLLGTHPAGPVVLACTDLYAYAPLLRARGVTVVDAVEELVEATFTTLTALLFTPPALASAGSLTHPLASSAFEEAAR